MVDIEVIKKSNQSNLEKMKKKRCPFKLMNWDIESVCGYQTFKNMYVGVYR